MKTQTSTQNEPKPNSAPEGAVGKPAPESLAQAAELVDPDVALPPVGTAEPENLVGTTELIDDPDAALPYDDKDEPRAVLRKPNNDVSASSSSTSEPVFGWRDYLAKDIGWQVIDAVQSILFSRRSAASKQRAVARELANLAKNKWGECLLEAATCREDPVLFFRRLWKSRRAVYRSAYADIALPEYNEFAARATIREFIKNWEPCENPTDDLVDICFHLLVHSRDDSGATSASWPSRFCAMLKAKKHLPPASGHIKPDIDSVRDFFDSNPQRTPPVQERIRSWLQRGSRRETFRCGWGNISNDQVLVDIYPERHVVWMSPNLVALRADVEQLRRQHPCISQVLKLRVFLDFRYDPENQFAPDEPHNVLGFICNAEERFKARADDRYIVKLRRALAHFYDDLYCEEEDDPVVPAAIADDYERLPEDDLVPARGRTAEAIRARLSCLKPRE